MAMRELKQTHYLDVADANIRHDTRDHRQDMTHYHVPLMRLHQAALHGWGIAVGLEVTQTGSAEVTIAEGLAIDAAGRMLPLAADGHAPGQAGKAFVHTTSPGNLADVPVVVPMGEIDDGTYYVTMELAVTPGPEGPVEGRFLASEGRVVSTPLVRVQPTASVTRDGQAIILATATLAEGAVTQLHGADRQLAHLAAGAVVLRRSAGEGAAETGPAVGEAVGGRLGALATGGVQVTVPQASDQVVVHREGEHNFRELTVRADHLRVLDGAGRDVMHAEANTATLRLGAQGLAGTLVVQDASGAEVLRLDSAQGVLQLGGDLEVKRTIRGNLAEGSVGTDQLADKAIIHAKIAEDTIGSALIAEADGTSGQNRNTGSGVKTSHIQDNAVTAAKLSPGAVGRTHLQNNAVRRAHLANNAVDNSKVADNTLSLTKLAHSGWIFDAEVAIPRNERRFITVGGAARFTIASVAVLENNRSVDWHFNSATMSSQLAHHITTVVVKNNSGAAATVRVRALRFAEPS